MAITANGPTANYTTAYPLPMIQANSIRATHTVLEVLSPTSVSIDCAVYVLNWSTRILSRLPESTVTFDCSTAGVKTQALPGVITLQPRNQYFIGFCPTGDSVLRVLGALVAPWKVAGAVLADTLTITDKGTKAWTTMPAFELLSAKGNEVL